MIKAEETLQNPSMYRNVQGSHHEGRSKICLYHGFDQLPFLHSFEKLEQDWGNGSKLP